MFNTTETYIQYSICNGELIVRIIAPYKYLNFDVEVYWINKWDQCLFTEHCKVEIKWSYLPLREYVFMYCDYVEHHNVSGFCVSEPQSNLTGHNNFKARLSSSIRRYNVHWTQIWISYTGWCGQVLVWDVELLHPYTVGYVSMEEHFCNLKLNNSNRCGWYFGHFLLSQARKPMMFWQMLVSPSSSREGRGNLL